MTRLHFAAALAAAGLLGACAGSAVKATPGDASASVPVDAPAAFAEAPRDGPQMNALGGEIPRSAPTADVGEGAIGEAEPG